jgi:hypothetical protein
MYSEKQKADQHRHQNDFQLDHFVAPSIGRRARRWPLAVWAGSRMATPSGKRKKAVIPVSSDQRGWILRRRNAMWAPTTIYSRRIEI